MATAINEGSTKFSGPRISIWWDKTSKGTGHKILGDVKLRKVGSALAWNGKHSSRNNKYVTQKKFTFAVTGVGSKSGGGTVIKTEAAFVKLLLDYKNGWIVYNDDKGEEIGALNRFEKTPEYKGGRSSFNKGNISEIIQAIGLFLRFSTRTNTVRKDHIEAELRKISRGAKNGSKTVDAPNKDINVKDKVTLQWTATDNNWAAVSDMKNWTIWEGVGQADSIVDSAVKFANSDNVVAWAELMYTNKVKNCILVNAMGETDQTKTKIDVRVDMTDHEGNFVPIEPGLKPILISFKYGGVGQFGQFGGVTYDVQEKVWGSSFGIAPLSKVMSEKTYKSYFKTTDHITDNAVAMQEMYKAVLPEIRKMFEAPKTNKASVVKFANFIKAQATLGEDYVVMVGQTGGEAIEYNLDKVEELLLNLKGAWNFYLTESTARSDKDYNLPILKIAVGDKLATGAEPKDEDVLLDIRVKRGEKDKKGNPYYRNVFEKKKKFSTLFARKLTQTSVTG